MKRKIMGINLMSSSICNLNCSYCYIPKDKDLPIIHKKMCEDMKDGSIFRYLDENYDTSSITSIGFWGAEPLLNIDIIYSFLCEAFKKYPIREAILPTNLTNDISLLTTFIDKISKFNNNFSLDIQISIDGPDFINDLNRGSGVTEKIIKNIHLLLNYLNNKYFEKLRIKIFPKSTWNKETLKILDDDILLLKKTDDFYKELHKSVTQKNKNQNVEVRMEYAGNLCLPGGYNKEDGERFTRLLHHIYTNKYRILLPNYYNHFLKIIEGRKHFNRWDYLTCSSAKTNACIAEDNSDHLCHRTFQLAFDKEAKYRDEYIPLFVKGDNIKKQYMALSHHYFQQTPMIFTTSLVIEMAKSGEILETYKTPLNAYLLSRFVNKCCNCPVENILETFNIYINPMSFIRLLGNGALEILLRKYSNER